MNPFKYGVASVLLATLLSGCASAPPWPAEVGGKPLTGARTLDVPFFPQERYQCGPAALATVLSAQGSDVTPEELVPQVYLPEREGSLKVELVAAARRNGMLVYPLDKDISALLDEVDAGHPVLVMQNLGFDWFPQWHFAVVIGYDVEDASLVLHTDTRKANRQPLGLFYRTWERAGQWAAVVLKPSELPATAEPLRFLEAANDLEVTGRTEPALTAYQTAANAWPEEPAAFLGQGNIAFQRGQWTEAADYYRDAVRRFPSLAPGWNNYAHALANLGCNDEAQQALRCANTKTETPFPDDLPRVKTPQPEACPAISCPIAN